MKNCESSIVNIALLVILLVMMNGCQNRDDELDSSFSSDWSNKDIDRSWAGREYWLNPLQAWRQKDGKLSCVVSGGDRNVILLSREIDKATGSFEMSVDIERLQSKPQKERTNTKSDQNETDGNIPKGLSQMGWVGFQIGVKGQFEDYRDDAIKGRGMCMGITTEGLLFIGDLTHSIQTGGKDFKKGSLLLSVKPDGDEMYHLTMVSFDDTGSEIASLISAVHSSWFPGLMALTCSQSIPDTIDWSSSRPDYNDIKDLNKSIGGNTSFAFSNWHVEGDKIVNHDDHSFGPILWTQHTLSDNIMKMSAQFVPIGNGNREAVLYIDEKEEQKSVIDQNGRNAIFIVRNWEGDKNHSYRIDYESFGNKKFNYEGIIKKEPTANVLKLASMSCVDDRGFPHQDLVDNVNSFQADLLAFHGDQLYERVAGYGVERNNMLDYQRKWYIFGWSFRELMRNTPAIIIPDDHDVFHGNLWGEGGKAADISLGYGYDAQDDGGYKESPEFVNMVHRTQSGHLPDPYDPDPVLQGISVYYTNMNYGGVSFAILGDRQWKSAPNALLPEAKIENGWPQNKSWNAKTQAYHPKAELLGPRQEVFLEDWVMEWGENIDFKVVISQSPFCNVATLPKDIYHDKYVPGLRRYRKGEYPVDDRPVADFDSNGWPQNKRNKAIKIMRKAFAIHITGDQHLGSTGQYGVDQYGDAGYWVSTPAVSNLWPRRWFPAKQSEGGKKAGDSRRYTGNYEDGFGNKITVKAIANPYDIDREPSMVFDKAPGYSMIYFDKTARKIDVEVWPRWASRAKSPPDNNPYEGWPISIKQTDNFGNRFQGHLPLIEVNGSEVVHVLNEKAGELILSYRPRAGSFSAGVDDKSATYTLKKLISGKVIFENNGLRIVRDN